MSSESDWTRVDEEGGIEIKEVIRPVANIFAPDDDPKEYMKNPFALRDLPEYQLFLRNDEDSQLQPLRVPSGSLSACSDQGWRSHTPSEANESEEGSDEDSDQNELDIEQRLMCSIKQAQRRQQYLFMSTILVMLILALSIAFTWTTKPRIVLVTIEPNVSENFELMLYGNTEVQEIFAQQHFVQILLTTYARCFMTVMRMGQRVGEEWMGFVSTIGRNILYRK